MEKPKNLEDLKRIFSQILDLTEDRLPFEFYERDGKLVAHQNCYIASYEDWFKIFDYARQTGRFEQDEQDRSWYFVFPKTEELVEPKEPSGLPLQRAATEETKPSMESLEPLEPGHYPEFPVDHILIHPFSFRANIDEGLDELVTEIRVAGMIIEPLVCRPAEKPGYVELCAGERRLRAAKKLGMRTVPIIVKELSNVEFDRIRMLENLARKDMSDIEIARVLRYMLEKYPEEYPSQEALANAFGKSRRWVLYHLKMLELEEVNFKNVNARSQWTEILSKITEFQAREILSAPPEKRVEVAEWIVKKYEETGEIPSAREIREFVHLIEAPLIEEETKPPLSKSVVQEALERTLFPAYPKGVDLETIRRELSEYDTSNLSDILLELQRDGVVVLDRDKWMSKIEYDRKQAELDELRFKIREAEQVLIDNYGFNPKRGIETYNISQIKLLAEKNGPTEEFLKDLKKCVDLLKDYYRIHHDMEEFRPIDSNTRNIDRIDRYLQRAKPVKLVELSGTDRRNCPVCGRPLTKRVYETLKRKFSHYGELFKE